MNVLIEVLSIEPPKPGGKVYNVVTTTGAKLEIWPDKIAEIRIGGRYGVELKEREFKGRTIRTITRIAPPSEPPQDTKAVPSSAGVEAFCAAMLAAFIASGEIKLGEEKKLADATSMLKRLHNWAFAGQISAHNKVA